MDLLSASDLVAIYATLVCFSMLGTWTMLLATNQMLELHEKPKEAAFHLARFQGQVEYYCKWS